MSGGPETKRRKHFQEKVSKCDERIREVKMGLGNVGRTSTRAGEAGAGGEPGRDVPGQGPEKGGGSECRECFL